MKEYKIVPYNTDAATFFEVDINKFAQEGWQFEAVLTRGNYTSHNDTQVSTADLLFSRQERTESLPPQGPYAPIAVTDAVDTSRSRIAYPPGTPITHTDGTVT